MKKIFSILFALVLVAGLGLATAAPALADTIRHVPSVYPTIQAALNASEDGDTIMVEAGEYDAFQVIDKTNINIISTEGATVTTANLIVDVPVVGDAWVMAGVKDSENINIESINFDGTDIIDEEVVVGIAYVDSTGSIADLTVENVIGTELGAGVAILGDSGTSVVDLSGTTVENSMAGVAIWDAEANLDGCTITEMKPDGGFGIMESGVGIVIGIPGEEWSGPSAVEMTGSTISNNDVIGIYVCDGSTLEAHFNNIVENADGGVVNDGGGTVDATQNWWGHASGPLCLTNPLGEGNAVIGNVDFEPWLEAEVGTAKTETVTGEGIVDAKDEADTEVEVDGTATVTVAKYNDNPGGPPPTGFILLNKYIDVYVPDTTEVTEIEIRLYYTDDDLNNAGIDDEELLQLMWWNDTKAEWDECSIHGVSTTAITIGSHDYSGYMWAKITEDTTPSLDYLKGGDYGGMHGEHEAPGGCFIATAAYGTATARELDILREYRDEVLLPNSLGAKLVSFYYRTSPSIADLISQNELLRTAVRVGFVDPIVKILTWSHDLWST